MIQPYSIPLALTGLLPVLFSAAGLFLIARALKRTNEIVGELATIGAGLIVAGELLRAFGQLIYATTGADYARLGKGQIVLLAPGFVCFAWALWRGLGHHATKLTAGQVWLLPLFLNAGLLALTVASRLILGGRAWFMILFTVTTLTSIAASLQLVRRAFQLQLTFAGILLLVNLLMLTQLIGKGGDTLVAEWTRQISNTISQAAFAFAAFQMVRKKPELI